MPAGRHQSNNPSTRNQHPYLSVNYEPLKWRRSLADHFLVDASYFRLEESNQGPPEEAVDVETSGPLSLGPGGGGLTCRISP